MLDLGIYTVRKSDPQNMAKYDKICQLLMRFVDRNGWNPEVHDRALKDRLQTKMGLIKKQLIKEGRIEPNGAGAYVKTGSSSAGGPLRDPMHLDSVLDDAARNSRGSSIAVSSVDDPAPPAPVPEATGLRPEDRDLSPERHVEPEQATDDAERVEQIKDLLNPLDQKGTSEVMGFILDKLEGTDMFWALLVERCGSASAARIEQNLGEVWAWSMLPS